MNLNNNNETLTGEAEPQDSGKQGVSNSTGFPRLSKGQKWVLGFCYVLAVFSAWFVADQLCFRKYHQCACCAYITLGFILAVIIIDRLIRHKWLVHSARLEDKSEVQSLIVEAKTLEPRFEVDGQKRPENYKQKEQDIAKEIKRLEMVLGPDEWTEYQVLSLNQLLVDFLKVEDLKSRAMSCLEDLQEYGDDCAGRYDQQHYDQWKSRIESACSKIDEPDDVTVVERDDLAETLRAEVRTLMEHVADYDQYWAEGSTIVRGLMTCGVTAIPLLLIMGLLPVSIPHSLNSCNWRV